MEGYSLEYIVSAEVFFAAVYAVLHFVPPARRIAGAALVAYLIFWPLGVNAWYTATGQNEKVFSIVDFEKEALLKGWLFFDKGVRMTEIYVREAENCFKSFLRGQNT